MSLNSHYLVLFKNPRDLIQISILSRQMYPDKHRFLIDAFKKATEKPYDYLLIDLKATTLDEYRIRSHIFKSDEKNYVYIPE